MGDIQNLSSFGELKVINHRLMFCGVYVGIGDLSRGVSLELVTQQPSLQPRWGYGPLVEQEVDGPVLW